MGMEIYGRYGYKGLTPEEKKTVTQLEEKICSGCGGQKKWGRACDRCGKLCDCPSCSAPITERYESCKYCGSGRICELASCS